MNIAPNGHHLKQPYPHLFVIIDEYAEMISSNPEFREQLESITRVGRAQGVHLLLASQRPIGITDQMRANIKFRICLRVEEVETSREMLRRPEAAYLPNGIPGRGYLQIGNDNIELIQAAYTGEVYRSLEVDAENSNRDIDLDDAKFYDRTVILAQDLAQNRQQKAPWPRSLAKEVTLQGRLDEKYWGADDIAQVMLESQSELALNPFVRDWQNGDGRWRRIDWGQARLSGIAGLVDDPKNARQLPLSINISNGHVVLFGASGRGKTTFLRTLITSLAVTYSPDDLHVHLLDLGGRQLDMLSTLPHVGTLIMPDERGYEERVQQLLKELEEVIEYRRQRFGDLGVFNLFEYNQSNPQDTLPAMLIAIDNFGEFVENFSDQNQTDDEESIWNLFISLLRQGKAYGIHVVITAPRMNILSSSLYSLFTERLTLRLADPDAYRAIVGHDVPPIDEIAGRGYMNIKRSALEFQVAWIRLLSDDSNGNPQQLNESQSIRLLGGLMAQNGADQWSQHRPFRIEALPKSSSYRQVLTTHFELQHDTSFTEQLGAAMKRRWDETARLENADWLEFILGISSGNRHRALHMSAKTDGVHGLVAGGTGSGKSELLMTMIVGLVVNYSPQILNFVLVDYKGGGAFRPFEDLPHCVDLVTNLDATAVDRMFTSINAEIHRRQLLNAETETKDIVDYRRKGFHITREPYPHLVIIIDEYAEMIDENPDYKSQLESITRVGRAQGINLILASQRPKGVSDQMRANIKFRICLRVEELDTSREMLRRPDAAYLPSLPGRGYMQVGNDNIELIQVSYTGEQQSDDRLAPVIWQDRSTDRFEDDGDEASEPLFDMVTAMARELFIGESVKQPWPKFLPRFVSLQAPVFDSQRLCSYSLADDVVDWSNGEPLSLWPGLDWRKAMTPTVGLVDNPRQAQQGPLTVNLRSSHLLVLGDSGSGKSTFLRTAVMDLCASHSPAELHIYVLDLGGRTFRSLEELPHVGSVIYADEEKYEERLERLLAKLNNESRSRQKQLSDASASNIYEYNNQHPEQAIPAILVVIDNFSDLRESDESLVENTLTPLVRRALPSGISFAMSANLPSNLPGRLLNLFGIRPSLRQTNLDQYKEIVGGSVIDFGNIPGRGYLRSESGPLLFQVALPAGYRAESSEEIDLSDTNDEVAQIMRHMNGHWPASGGDATTGPDPIPTLPEEILLRDLIGAIAGAIFCCAIRGGGSHRADHVARYGDNRPKRDRSPFRRL